MPPVDPTSGGGESRPQQIVVDDLGRFDATARAFSMALDALCSARGPFAAGAANISHAWGNAHLAARYQDTFSGMLRTLDAMESCFKQFSHLLAAVGATYERADDSIADGIP